MHLTSDAAGAPRQPSRTRRGLSDAVSRGLSWAIDRRARVLVCIAAAAIVLGTALHLAGHGAAGDDAWGAAVALLAAELSVEVVRTVFVKRQMGVDTIALLAMVGALALGQELAGVVIGLMFSGGSRSRISRPVARVVSSPHWCSAPRRPLSAGSVIAWRRFRSPRCGRGTPLW